MSSSNPVFADIHGAHYNIPGAVPVQPPGGGGGVPGAPTVPSSAKIVVLDNSNNWKGEHDTATGGSSTGTTKYLGSGKGRLFDINFNNNAGYRWHCNFANDTAPRNYRYKLGVSFDRPDLLGCLELDINHVPAKDKVYYLCTQATSWNKCWEITSTPHGKCQWNKTNLSVNPLTWPANKMQEIEIYVSHDDKGNVTYHGIAFNGTYSSLETTAQSMLPQNWSVGENLINFQLGGRGTTGSIQATALNIELARW